MAKQIKRVRKQQPKSFSEQLSGLFDRAASSGLLGTKRQVTEAAKRNRAAKRRRGK